MYRAQVAIDDEFLVRLRQVVMDLPELVQQYVRRELRPFVSQEVDRRLRRPPGPVKYPIQWTSEKQRRAFFATDGFGHGIPYQRSGKLVSNWTVRADYRDTLSSITITNAAPQAQYVYGPRQQRFHRNTGWPVGVEVLQVISLLANAFAADGLSDIVRRSL